jgi:hypothetical protein
MGTVATQLLLQMRSLEARTFELTERRFVPPSGFVIASNNLRDLLEKDDVEGEQRKALEKVENAIQNALAAAFRRAIM